MDSGRNQAVRHPLVPAKQQQSGYKQTLREGGDHERTSISTGGNLKGFWKMWQ